MPAYESVVVAGGVAANVYLRKDLLILLSKITKSHLFLLQIYVLIMVL